MDGDTDRVSRRTVLTRSAMTGEQSAFHRAITTAVTRRADRHVEDLDRARHDGRLRHEERELLGLFEGFAAEVLDRYVPPSVRRSDSLVFAELYAAAERAGATDPPARIAPDGDEDERRRHVVTALLAAEVEARGPLRLSRLQCARLGRILHCLGQSLARDQLPVHAAHAHERAAELYLQTDDPRERDRCLLHQARARRAGMRPGPAKLAMAVSGALCGYGYLPYRLLAWILVQLLVFGALLILLANGGAGVWELVYVTVVNYLNPLGDTNTSLPHTTWLLLSIESYAGSVSTSVFFALLVRRWFRT